MTKVEFFQHFEHQDQRYKKLAVYEEFVIGKLELYPETRSAQIHDWLKEMHPAFPPVYGKTEINLVQYICQKYNIPQQFERRYFSCMSDGAW